MAKSVVSALFGIAVEEGYIKSLDQHVDEYLPNLKGSGYEGVKIKDVLQMASGVKLMKITGILILISIVGAGRSHGVVRKVNLLQH